MTSVSSANDEAASSSHGEVITSLGCSSSNIDNQDVKMKRVADYMYMDPQLYEARLHMNSVSGSQGEIITTTTSSDQDIVKMKKEEYTYMDPLLYKAAADGSFGPFDIIEKELSLIITPDKNTILHIHIRSQDIESTTTGFMKQVVAKCPSLRLQVNAIGDTPLHVAAKYGNNHAVKFLIDSAKVENDQRVLPDNDIKQMLRKTNNAGNTPLHEAVQHDFHEVVILLSREDPDFLYPSNNLGETPLYLAVQKGDYGVEMVDQILKDFRKLAYEGPHGRTALHAAAKSNDDSIVRKVLYKKKSLAKEVDEYGWTPLHYAAYYGNRSTVKVLLEFDVCAAYVGEKERKMTPLHLAASQGHVHNMNEIISNCPTCYELVDIKGRNVLHFAILTLTVDQFRRITHCLPLTKIINQKDADGNTPLHVGTSLYPEKLNTVFNGLLGPANSYVTNNQGFNVCEIGKGGFPQLKQEILELSKTVHEPFRLGVVRLPSSNKYIEVVEIERADDVAEIERAKESHLVVAALIATVTFAAAFTLPGGYIQDGSHHQGTAILKGNSAFQAFVITNAMAMVLSVSAVFIHFLMSLKSFRSFIFMFWYAFVFTLLAMGAMVIAFITAAYAMLWPSLRLAIVTICIGLAFFFLAIYLLNKVTIIFKKPLTIFKVLFSNLNCICYPNLNYIKRM
ncbi:hypothetical protein ACOSQ4_007937 [Xanthoceras sorbifolium]